MGFLLGYMAGQAASGGPPQQHETKVIVSEKYDVITCRKWEQESGGLNCAVPVDGKLYDKPESIYVYAGKRGYKFVHRVGAAIGEKQYIVMEVSK